MSSPIEFRYYLPKYTLEHARSGVQYIRQNGELYHPPTLQWRCREKVTIDGADKVQWSEWADVPYVREE